MGIRVGLAVAALGLAALAAPLAAQEGQWYAVGERLLVDIPEDALFLNGQDYDGSYIEDYALEVGADGTVISALRFMWTREDNPFSAVSPLEAARTIEAGIMGDCRALQTNGRSLLTVDGRPGLTLDLTCPADAAAGGAAQYTWLTNVAGEERMFTLIFMGSPDTSRAVVDAHLASVAAGVFCTIDQPGGACRGD